MQNVYAWLLIASYMERTRVGVNLWTVAILHMMTSVTLVRKWPIHPNLRAYWEYDDNFSSYSCIENAYRYDDFMYSF